MIELKDQTFMNEKVIFKSCTFLDDVVNKDSLELYEEAQQWQHVGATH